MYGPSYAIKLKIGMEYNIPSGYGWSGDVFNGGYQYTKSIFIGLVKRGEDTYWVFKNEKGFQVCLPNFGSQNTGDDYELVINWNPRGFGKTIEEAFASMGPRIEMKLDPKFTTAVE